VLLLDELNTRLEDREFVRLSMLQYVASMPPGTSLAIYALGSRLRLVQNFTSDVAQLTQALQSPKKAKNIPIEVANVGPQITLAAIEQLAQYLGAIPGRKNLIWFAGSFPISFDPGASLSAARVAVYPVDAEGLHGLPGFDASIGGMGDGAAIARALDAKFRNENPTRQGMMKDIATATGGHAFLDTNGFKEAVANIIENGSNYYTIGYQPTPNILTASIVTSGCALNLLVTISPTGLGTMRTLPASLLQRTPEGPARRRRPYPAHRRPRRFCSRRGCCPSPTLSFRARNCLMGLRA
jgi:VWFA-related protein